VEQIQWWGGSIANGDTAYMHFEYSKGLCIKYTDYDSHSSGSVVYEYNSRGLPVKMIFYTGNTYYYTNFFEYNSEDRLIRVTDSSWQLNYIYEYSYDDQGNPSIEIASNVSDSSKTRNEWTSYDDKINYTCAINGLPTGSLFTNDFHGYFSSMPHNVLTNNFTTTVFPYSSDAPGTFQFQYQYQYNEQGLPTQIVSGPWIITNIYRKYK
jgi:YD repeat-containing protein